MNFSTSPLRWVPMLLAWCSAAAIPCGAQRLEPPTDADVAAAYCIGVLQRQLQITDGMPARPSELEDYAAQQIGDHRHELRGRLQRLQSHLEPRLSRLDLAPLAGATARAIADVDWIMAYGRRASEECHRIDDEAQLQCALSKVQGTRPWRRMDRCERDDFLPL